MSGLLRLIHESSHLGDEYLLKNPLVDRINLSYETLDLLVSWHVTDELRVYGGGGNIVHSHTDLDRWIVHGGVEWLAPEKWGAARPVAAIDVQSREYTDWTADVSLRAGVQFQDSEGPRGRVQLMVEYYRGSSPNGQLRNGSRLRRDPSRDLLTVLGRAPSARPADRENRFYFDEVEFVGIGLHFYF